MAEASQTILVRFGAITSIDYRNANKILELKNSEGEILRNHNDISALLSNHFSNIAQEPSVNREAAIQEITSAIPHLVTGSRTGP